jgi:hypothetical protein
MAEPRQARRALPERDVSHAEALPAQAPLVPASLAGPLNAPAAAPSGPEPSPAQASPPDTPGQTLAASPDLAVSSDRLGTVAVRLQGGPEQLQVAVQAQPVAAALIDAQGQRLRDDLAAAGVTLAGLSVNGQHRDLAGDGRRGGRTRHQLAAIDSAAPGAGRASRSLRTPNASAARGVERFA